MLVTRVTLIVLLLAVAAKGIPYDYIIVGSGASGSILASRLSANGDTVLVLEAGGPSQADLGGEDYVASRFVKDPITGETTVKSLTRYDVPLYRDTQYATELLPTTTWNISTTDYIYPQAKLLGGNMAWNGYVWTRPVRADLDNWDVPGWTWNDVLPFFKKSENVSLTPYASDTQNHSTTGPIHIESTRGIIWETQQFLNACRAAGYPELGDYNNGGPRRGCGPITQNTYTGIRDSSATAYLAPALATRPNLRLKINALVTRILFKRDGFTMWDDADGDVYNAADYESDAATTPPKAIGVQFINKNGVTKRVRARKEVILAGGALQTPKLLMLSGIGPQSVLSAFNIPAVVVNNKVGQNIRNHLTYRMTVRQAGKINANLYNLANAHLEYARTGTGPFSLSPGGDTITYFTAHPNHNRYDIRVQVSPSTAGYYDQTFYPSIGLDHVQGANGSLNLTSANPLAPPIYSSNHQQNDEDIATIAYGILETRKILAKMPNVTELVPGPQYATFTQLYNYIRPFVSTVCHYHGSVAMGTTTAFPVDVHGRVRGVTRLRVVDTSVIPGKTSGGMQASAVAIAEKLAASVLSGN